jgi:hypothetical protein
MEPVARAVTTPSSDRGPNSSSIDGFVALCVDRAEVRQPDQRRRGLGNI